MPKHSYGWIRDKPSTNDYSFRRFQAPFAVPRKFDFVNECPPVKNQFQVGTCAAFASSYAKEHLRISEGKPYMPLSARFIFTEGTQAEGHLGTDGMQIRSGLDVLRSFGVPPESDCPYNGGQNAFDLCEAPNVLKDAQENTIRDYAVFDNVSQICQALSQKIGIVAGVTVYDSWETQEVEQDGIIPHAEGNVLGGHAIFFCGFNMDALNGDGWFVFENSWDVTWAQNNPYQAGFGCIGMKYVQDELDSNAGTAYSSIDSLPSPTPAPIPIPTPTPAPSDNRQLVLAESTVHGDGVESVDKILYRYKL